MNAKRKAQLSRHSASRKLAAGIGVAASLLLTVPFAGAPAARAQAPGSSPSASLEQSMGPALPQASALLGPTLTEIRLAITNLRIAKWKAPGPVKDDAQQNVASITRDLDGTLQGLINEADATPHSIGNSFAVYRNLNALYEVLLRVSGTADLAAPDNEAQLLTHALGTLDASRASLADSIFTTTQAQQAAFARVLERQRPVQVAAPLPPPTTTVVSDGPTRAAKPRVKPRHKAAAPAPQPAPGPPN